MPDKGKQNHFIGSTETVNEKEISEDFCGLCEKEEREMEIRPCLLEEKRMEMETERRPCLQGYKLMEINPEDLPDFQEKVDCGLMKCFK
jgi:hypothetical protein